MSERSSRGPGPVLKFVQRRIANPAGRRVARFIPGMAVLETTGRRSGLPRRTPVGGALEGSTFWFVSEFGRGSQYVLNLEADPRVRVQIGNRWRTGRAFVVEGDDVVARLRKLPRLNSLFVRLVGADLLTVRVDLD